YDHVTALIDPFGNATLDLVTKYWTAAERNSQLPALQGPLLENRLIWLGFAAVLFAVAYVVFRFEDRGVRPRRKAAGVAESDTAAASTAAAAGSPSWRAQAGGGHAWQAFLTLTRFDMRSVFTSPAFFVLLALGVLNAYGALLGTMERDDIT